MLRLFPVLLLFGASILVAQERNRLPQIDAMKARIQKSPAAPKQVDTFQLVEARWAKGAIRGLGDFDECHDHEVDVNAMNIYLEMVNPGYHEEHDQYGPRFISKIEAIGHFFSKEGAVLGHKSLGVTEMKRLKAYPVQAFGIQLALSDKLDAGRYRVDIELHDKITQKRSQKTLHFIKNP